jgi:hypothetical protein
MNLHSFQAWLERLAKEKRYRTAREEEFYVPFDVAPLASPEAKVAVAELLGDIRIAWRRERARPRA